MKQKHKYSDRHRLEARELGVSAPQLARIKQRLFSSYESPPPGWVRETTVMGPDGRAVDRIDPRIDPWGMSPMGTFSHAQYAEAYKKQAEFYAATQPAQTSSVLG